MLALAAGCGLPVSVISGVVLGGWDMPDGGVELSGVEPFHVLGGGQLDCVWLLLLVDRAGIRRSTALAAAWAEAIRDSGPSAAPPRGRCGHPARCGRLGYRWYRHGRADRTAGRGVPAPGWPGCGYHRRVRRQRHRGHRGRGAAGKPLPAVVKGKPGHGSTLGGGTVGTAAPASPSPTPPGSATGTAATAPATSATPSCASSSSAAPLRSAVCRPPLTPVCRCDRHRARLAEVMTFHGKEKVYGSIP